MVCAACGKTSAYEFCFCPHCGRVLNSEPSPSESISPSPEVKSATETPANQSTPTKQGVGGGTIRPGTVVFGVFSAISWVVAVCKGLPPICILEAVGWAGLAWYWQRKKTHSELAKGIVAVLAIVVAIGEVAHFAIQADSQSKTAKAVDLDAILSTNPAPTDRPDAPTEAGGSNPYAGILEAKNGPPPGVVLECPAALPAGVNARPLPANELSNVAGTFGKLISKPAPWPEPDDVLLWDANLGFGNKTGSCISTVVVELELDHGGVLSKERHSVVFQPLLGPRQATDDYVSLKIRTTDRGEGVALLGWHTVSASGFRP